MYIYKEMFDGIKGFIVWKRLIKSYDCRRDNFFLVYQGEEHLIKYINKYLYSWMYEKRAVRVVIFTSIIEAADKMKARFVNNPNIEVVKISENQEKLIIKAYWFNVLGDRLMIVSLKNLYGRNLYRVIGKKGISEEEIFASGLFNLELKEKRGKNETRTNWAFRVRT